MAERSTKDRAGAPGVVAPAPRAPETRVPPSIPRRPPFTLRAVLIALLLIPLNSLWIVHTEIVRYAGHPTTTSLFYNVIFCLAILVAINALLARFWPRMAFSQGELLVIYTLLSLGSAMVGHDMLQVLIATLVHPFWFASEDNRWHSLFFDQMPRWLMMDDRAALRGYFLGNTSLYHREFLLAWARPVAIWTAFFMVLVFMMMCLNVIWRRQWTENERLSFPIIQLPLQMTDERFTLFRTRNLWLGFALAGLIDTLNTLSANYPSWPSLPIRDIQLQQYLVDRPWNAIGWTPLGFFPFVIGIGFLLPLDLSFSCWFFYLYWKSQMVITAVYGWNEGRVDFPYIEEQSAGAFLGVCVFVVWVSRGYLKNVLRAAFGRGSRLEDGREPLTYRQAVIGFLIGFAALVIFSVYAGISPGISALFMLIFFMLSVAVDRMRAELGSPAHDLHHAGPDQLITEVWGAKAFDKSTLAAFSIYEGFNRAYRSHPMPHQMEGFRLAQSTSIPLRPFLWVMLLASLWGTLCAFWALLHVYYQLGAGTAKIVGPSVWFGWEPYRRLAGWTGAPQPRDPLETWFLGGGFAFSLFLMVMRTEFLWWPFHPVGLAVSSSWAMNYMWFPLFIAWVAKAVILRSSGLKGYRTALPFFLGLVLGEFVVGAFWNLAGLLFHLEIYRFWG
jgi:Family of unknown function (DUF6785)/Domain of unknown function (DUF6784)